MTFAKACAGYVISLLFCVLLASAVGCQPTRSPAENVSVSLPPRERHVEVSFQIHLRAPENSKDVRLWIPYAVSDENQAIGNVRIEGNYSGHGVYKEEEFGNSILYAEWQGPRQERVLAYRFQVHRREAVKKDFPSQPPHFSPAGLEEYLRPTSLAPTNGKVKQRAETIVATAQTPLARARAIYDWIVDNMYRDPNVKGCGYGEVERLLDTRGGKCGDLHSVYVALAKSVGIPTREIFGIRLPADSQGDMTKAQHCWAEFFLPAYGWVPIDAADVRKIMLEKGLPLGQEKPYREYYFGAVDGSRIAYGWGRDVVLHPPQKDGNLNYFMYPYAEADGKALNEDLYGYNLGYTITYKNL